ncbi:MAG: hypothetical protein ACYTGZ_19700 [Planctomycetota bacterium]|jgi:hypothetical protein
MSSCRNTPLRWILIWAVLLIAKAPLTAEEPKFSVRVTAAETGQTLSGAKCGIVHVGSNRAYARFEPPNYSGAEAVVAGDTLYVYARGRDVARVTVADGQRVARVALKAASRQCSIRVRGLRTKDAAKDSEKGAGAGDVRLRLLYWIAPPGRWSGAPPIADRYEEQIPARHVRRTVPAGADIYVTGRGEGVLIWPRGAKVPAQGGKVTLHAEYPWSPVIRFDPPPKHGIGGHRFDFLPDYSVQPPGPPLRVDEWKWEASRAWWGQDRERDNGPVANGKRLSILPAVAFHLVGAINGQTVVRRCVPGEEEIDLRGAPPLRALAGLPIVDKSPTPGGSFILPGKLDVATIGGFLDVGKTRRGVFIALPEKPPVGWDPGVLALAPSRWISVWHPRHGLAHLRWDEGKVPTGSRYGGSMAIHAPEGWVMDGTITSFPIWRGTRRVKITPPDGHLVRKVRRNRVIRYGGLRPAWHAFVFRLDLIEVGGGRRHPIDYTYEVEIPEDSPRRTYRFHPPK